MIVTTGQQLQLEYLQHPDDERIKMMIMMCDVIMRMIRTVNAVGFYTNDDNDDQEDGQDDHDDTWAPG